MPLTSYTAGDVLTAQSLNDNFTFAAASGLTMVKAQTAFTTVASATADNVFTSAFADYLVLVSFITSSSNTLAFRLRASGTSTITNYTRQMITSSGASTTSALAAAQTSLVTETTNGNFRSFVSMHLANPQIADRTLIKLSGTFLNDSNTNAVGVEIYGNQNSATAFDGIQLLTATGTITGTFQIYGYSKTL